MWQGPCIGCITQWSLSFDTAWVLHCSAMAFDFPHHSAAPLRPVSDSRTLHCPCNSTTTAPTWLTVTHSRVALSQTAESASEEHGQTQFPTNTHTHTLQSLHHFIQCRSLSRGTSFVKSSCSCFWRSHFWPGETMMLIITPCSVIMTLNRTLEATASLSSYRFSLVFLSNCYWDSARQHTRKDRRQNGHNDWP